MAKNRFLRTCVICKTPKSKKDLFRFTIYNNEVVLDYFQKLEGRGFYTCKDLNCFNLLNKAVIKKNLKIDKDFIFQKEKMINIAIDNLKREILNNLKIANKSGMLVATLNKFIETFDKYKFKVIIIAKDISINSYKKIKKYLDNREVLNLFDKRELGSIFSKFEVNVIGVKDSEFQNMIIDKNKLLRNLLGG